MANQELQHLRQQNDDMRNKVSVCSASGSAHTDGDSVVSGGALGVLHRFLVDSAARVRFDHGRLDRDRGHFEKVLFRQLFFGDRWVAGWHPIVRWCVALQSRCIFEEGDLWVVFYA